MLSTFMVTRALVMAIESLLVDTILSSANNMYNFCIQLAISVHYRTKSITDWKDVAETCINMIPSPTMWQIARMFSKV